MAINSFFQHGTLILSNSLLSHGTLVVRNSFVERGTLTIANSSSFLFPEFSVHFFNYATHATLIPRLAHDLIS